MVSENLALHQGGHYNEGIGVVFIPNMWSYWGWFMAVYGEVYQVLCSQFTRSNKALPAPSAGPSESGRVATSPHAQKPTLKKSNLESSNLHSHVGKHSNLFLFDCWWFLMHGIG
jgi:hypothetical protein